MKNKRIMPGVALLIGIPIILSGCGLSGISQQANDQQKPKIQYMKPGDSLNKKKDNKKQNKKDSPKTSQKTTSRKLFLEGKNGLVVPETYQLPVPKKGDVAQQALQYLVKGGPISNLLPNGFQAVLPAGTEVRGASLKNGTLTVNFTKPFKNYKANQEKKILDAITWTATQFKNINHVKIMIDGVIQTSMPVNKTPIDQGGASRADGINQELGDVVDVTGTEPVTLYFPEQVGSDFYYVPVTTRMPIGKGKIVAAVNGLLNGPNTGSGLLDAFGNGVKLLGQPKIQDHVVTLNFNKNIYANPGKKVISNKELDSLVLSLTSQTGIKKVAIEVNGKAAAKTEAGKTLSKPVSRPKHVNTVGL